MKCWWRLDSLSREGETSSAFIWHLNVVTLSIYWCFGHIHLAISEIHTSVVLIILVNVQFSIFNFQIWIVSSTHQLFYCTFILSIKDCVHQSFPQLDCTIQWKFFNKLLHSNKHCLNLLKKIESQNMNKHFPVSFATSTAEL